MKRDSSVSEIPNQLTNNQNSNNTRSSSTLNNSKIISFDPKTENKVEKEVKVSDQRKSISNLRPEKINNLSSIETSATKQNNKDSFLKNSIRR